MSLDTPSYVVSLQNNIRSRPIPWEGAVKAKTISEDEHSKIEAIAKVRKETRKQVLENESAKYVNLFLGGGDGCQSVLQAASKRQEIEVYLLVLLDDAMEGENVSLSVNMTRTDRLDRQPVVCFSPIETSKSFCPISSSYQNCPRPQRSSVIASSTCSDEAALSFNPDV